MSWAPPGSTPPGWYPTDVGVVRWWDGRRWTGHVATAQVVRRRSQRKWRNLERLGIALIVIGIMAAVMGFFSVYGDPYLEVWLGVTRQDGQLVLVTSPCPSEHVTDVEIQLSGTWEQPGRTMWRLEGSAPLPRTIVVGSGVGSMTTVTPWDRSALASSELVVFLETDRSYTWGGLRWPFDPASVRDGEILTAQRTFADYDAFVAGAPDGTECEPWRPPWWWLAGTMAGFWVLAPTGLGLVLTAERPLPPQPRQGRRRRRRRRPPADTLTAG